jgi:hypothetical protein
MSAPVLVSMSPAAAEIDVVLGTGIEVAFDQPIDPTTVNASTFSLIGPSPAEIITPENLIKAAPVSTGRAAVPGKFSFPSPDQFLFTPARPLEPNAKYTVLIVGAGATLVLSGVKNPAGDMLAQSIQTTFQTGTLALNAAPPAAPLPWNDPRVQPWMRPQLDPSEIKVHPRAVVGNDITQVIELVFPAPIDPTSFDAADIGISVDPLVNDPLVAVPTNLQSTVQVDGNKIIVTITGWTS